MLEAECGVAKCEGIPVNMSMQEPFLVQWTGLAPAPALQELGGLNCFRSEGFKGVN